MQTSTILAFVLGFGTACGALYAAAPSSPVVAFTLGATAALAACVALLTSSKSARLVLVRILNGRRQATAISQQPKTAQAQEKKPAPAPPANAVSQDEADLISALVNFGARKPKAAAAAHDAMKSAVTFSDRFRYAVNSLKVAA